MAELILNNVDPAIITKLEARAERNHRSTEEEHHEILRDALVPGESGSSNEDFAAYLRSMPDLGSDADFARIEGEIRDVDLVN